MDMLEAQGAEVEMIDLARLPSTVAFSELYGARSEDFTQEFILKVEKAKKFVFIIPEYNGGFPGILKLFIDSLPPVLMHNKKAGLVGLSSGMTGALRPMDQFSNVLNYLQVDVIAFKPKLSAIEQMMDADGRLSDERCLKLLQDHALKMIEF
jgi:NAD(P)H-dependent FMN reductase